MADDLPPHDDDVTMFDNTSPYHDVVEVPYDSTGVPVEVPHHPSFPPSGVVVPIRSCPLVAPDREIGQTLVSDLPDPDVLVPAPDAFFLSVLLSFFLSVFLD